MSDINTDSEDHTPMSAISYRDTGDHGWDGPEQHDEDVTPLPGRPRRRFLNRWTATLIALIVGAGGFYAGVRIEKGQVSGSSAATGLSLPSGFPGAGTSTRSGSSSGTRSASGGLPAIGALGGGNSSFGTISSVDANTIYLQDASGNTIKVKLSSATKITKSVSVSHKSLRPGDTVVVQGLKNSKGSVSATSVSDSGAGSRATGSGGGAGASAGGSGSSGSAAVNSLFGSGR